MYVIKRTDQWGGWLGANPGVTGNTYVRNLQNARLFQTREQAKKECNDCNEIVQSIEEAMESKP